MRTGVFPQVTPQENRQSRRWARRLEEQLTAAPGGPIPGRRGLPEEDPSRDRPRPPAIRPVASDFVSGARPRVTFTSGDSGIWSGSGSAVGVCPVPGTPGKETAAVFSEYAKAICASLKSAWKDGRVPAGCVNRALFNLEDFVTLQLAKELGAVLIDHALFEVYKPQSALQEDDSMQ